MKKYNELDVKDLTKESDEIDFGFKQTDEVTSSAQIIGQERALKAIDFGLNIQDEWFNLYISGASGTGRNTAIVSAVEAIARKRKVPDDICYLYNFEKPDEPKCLALSAGKGCEFKRDMESLIKDLETEIHKSFLGEEYEKQRKMISDKFEKYREALDIELEEFAKAKGFVLEQTLTEVVVVPIYKGHRLTSQQYNGLSDEERIQIKNRQKEIDALLYENSRKARELQRHLRNELEELDKKIGLFAIGHLIEDLKKKYQNFDLILRHLDDIKEDILKNLGLLKKEPPPREGPFFLDLPAKEQDAVFSKYKVNLLIDNCKTQGAPVIIESNPTYYNLTGYVEYRAQFGVLTTDFTMIKPGAALKANGGYLIVQANQILRDYFAWDALKKIIRHKKVKIENLAEKYGFIPTTGLKPQDVPVDLKVIIVGDPYIYQLLYIYDEDFRKYFKVKVDFDRSIKKTEGFVQQFALLIAHKAKEENLLPFKKEAVAKVIDYGSRAIAHQEKISSNLLELIDLMKEADFWARRGNAKSVESKHVKIALDEKVFRSNMVENKIQELFEENTLFVDTEGMETGQINGISVINMGDYVFGMPSRITANTFIGEGEIVNIEREAKMSGKIHSKGVLILSGYLGQKFAQDKPLALSASICFEQLYEEVEGDSASSAELYCLISSISELPLRQDIAVTGSVNQKGKVQPVGGINEKIEGFYAVCKIKGLTGTQGVIIPKSNVKHLMIKDEVIDAVRNGKFHIYPVETIEEGIEILTGVEAGVLQENLIYKEGTVFYKVNEKLSQYVKLITKFSKTSA